MISIIIGIILLLIVLYIIGYFVKRKHFTYIDRLESWKIEIMNRPVLDEVSKIKQLTMAGETEEYFERWRVTWDSIVTEQLPSVEEALYEAEDLVEKYRFSKVKQVYTKIENALKEADVKINEMVLNLREIVDSEEKNQEDMANIHEQYKKLKKELLAHRYAFGKASGKLEENLAHVNEMIELVETETNNGNYLTARAIVLDLNKDIELLKVKMETIPLYLNECHHVIPNQLKEIKNGMEEMIEEGYQLEHLGIELEIHKIGEMVQSYVQYVENGDIDGIDDGLKAIKEQIEIMYQLLEEEVSSRKFVLSNRPHIEKSLEDVTTTNETLKGEVELVKETYHLSTEDVDLLNELQDKISTLKKMSELLLKEEALSTAAYSVVKDKVEDILEMIKDIEEKQQTLTESLQALRKDEFEAREKITHLKKRFQETARKVERSNIPGIPKEIETLFIEAHHAIQDALTSLEEKPLRMPLVQDSLQKAEGHVDEIYKKVEEMIENVYFIEKVIQYGNRYRKKYPQIHKRLDIAEEAFRRYDYTSALEEAAAAVEAVEPGAIKKIEEMINEEINQEN